MSDYERVTLKVEVARDANHTDNVRDPSWEFENVREYTRLDEIQLKGGSSRTINRFDFTEAGNIETFIVIHKTTTGTGVRVQFTDAAGYAVSHRISPGDWGKFSDVASDITLTNAHATTTVEVELYGAT
jgi:hypothetical protein